MNLLNSSQTVCAPGQPDIRKRHRKEILPNHLETYRPVWLPHGSDVHIVHEAHNWRSFAEFFRINPCLYAVCFQVLGKEDGTEIAFAEAAPFHDFQAQYLREVPAAIDHAHHHRSLAEIDSVGSIGICPTDNIHGIGHVFHFGKGT